MNYFRNLRERYNDARDSDYDKGYVINIINNITTPSIDDNTQYDINGTIREIKFIHNKIKDVTAIRMN